MISNSIGIKISEAEQTTIIHYTGHQVAYIFTSSGDCTLGGEVVTSAPLFATLTIPAFNIEASNCTQLLQGGKVSYNNNEWNLTIWKIDNMSEKVIMSGGV